MTASETDLATRAIRGDRGAFATLVEQHWHGLVGLARTVIGEATAEDAVQEAFITAWDKLSSLREPAAFTGWLKRIVLNHCLRKKRTWRDFLPIHVATEPTYSPSPEAELDLGKVLESLAPRQRAVIYLGVVEGLSESEIADLMQITAASVRSHRRRARERLSHVFDGASYGA